jgi:hypothetical protein
VVTTPPPAEYPQIFSFVSTLTLLTSAKVKFPLSTSPI